MNQQEKRIRSKIQDFNQHMLEQQQFNALYKAQKQKIVLFHKHYQRRFITSLQKHLELNALIYPSIFLVGFLSFKSILVPLSACLGFFGWSFRENF